MSSITIALIVITLTIYSIRLLPFVFLKKPIKNRWFRSFLYYVPYVTLSLMTFPSIIHATGNLAGGLLAFVIGLVVAYCTENLFAVAICCCLISLLCNYFLI
jgi:branched-subunit amino acid transport protein